MDLIEEKNQLNMIVESKNATISKLQKHIYEVMQCFLFIITAIINKKEIHIFSSTRTFFPRIFLKSKLNKNFFYNKIIFITLSVFFLEICSSTIFLMSLLKNIF